MIYSKYNTNYTGLTEGEQGLASGEAIKMWKKELVRNEAARGARLENPPEGLTETLGCAPDFALNLQRFYLLRLHRFKCRKYRFPTDVGPEAMPRMPGFSLEVRQIAEVVGYSCSNAMGSTSRSPWAAPKKRRGRTGRRSKPKAGSIPCLS